MRQFTRHGDSQAAAAGAEIEDLEPLRPIPFPQYQIDQQFGLGPRDQHIRRGGKAPSIKLAPADQVSDGLPRRAAHHQGFEVLPRSRVKLAFGSRGELSVAESGYVLQQRARIDRSDPLAGKRQCIANGHR